uniref:Uncharacterized protein n=1 Tax=Arundo donax TaxID=35708 RepID=A0A0A9C7I7_ARUDO
MSNETLIFGGFLEWTILVVSWY